MTELDKDIVALLSRRAYDLAGSCAGVKVYLNGERLPVSKFFKTILQPAVVESDCFNEVAILT